MTFSALIIELTIVLLIVLIIALGRMVLHFNSL